MLTLFSAQAAAEQAAEAEPDQAAHNTAAPPPEAARGTTIGGLGANLVSTVRSFLPFVSRAADAPPPPPAAGKKPVKVRMPVLTHEMVMPRDVLTLPEVCIVVLGVSPAQEASQASRMSGSSRYSVLCQSLLGG